MSDTVVNPQEKFVVSVQEAFNALEEIAKDPEAAKAMVAQPVGLRDTRAFNLPIEVISREEVSDLRQKLASAIASEKWADGFMFAIKLVMLFAAL